MLLLKFNFGHRFGQRVHMKSKQKPQILIGSSILATPGKKLILRYQNVPLRQSPLKTKYTVLLLDSYRALPDVNQWCRHRTLLAPCPSTLLLSKQFSLSVFPRVQELPFLFHWNTARKKKNRILNSPSILIRGSIGNRTSLSLIRKRPRNTVSECALALLPRCLELLKVDYM